MRHRAVLCDLDGVVLDYPAAEAMAFAGTATRLGLHDIGTVRPQYARINAALWKEYEQGAVTPEQLRVRRWKRLLDRHGLSHDPVAVSADYLDRLGRAGPVFPGAVAALRRLAAVVPVIAISNGFSSVAHGRLAASGTRDLFAGVVLADEVGAPKPDPVMFEAALHLAGGPDPAEAVMVGDNHAADVEGAAALGMDTVWIAPDDAGRSTVATWQVPSLRDAANLLLDQPESIA